MYNRNLNDLLREFMNEDLFSSSFTEFRLPKLRYNNDVNKREYSENTPSTNVYEDEWSYRYELSTPGFTKKDLTITLKESNLEIKGETKKVLMPYEGQPFQNAIFKKILLKKF